MHCPARGSARRPGLDRTPLVVIFFVFFFSSRRRHTRSKRDWSSDVCSSDLTNKKDLRRFDAGPFCLSPADLGTNWGQRRCCIALTSLVGSGGPLLRSSAEAKIGRASCRERVEVTVVGGS